MLKGVAMKFYSYSVVCMHNFSNPRRLLI